MLRRFIQGDGIPDSGLPFTPAVQVGPWIFVSGQASVDVDGKIVSGPFAEEMHRSLENVRRVLAAAGYALSDVVQVRSYVGRQEDLAEYNQIYRRFFAAPYPARTTLIGCLGNLLKFEIDVVACLPAEKAGTL
jgi:2-iminobutanoate/2-iminopropanoate deaminase